MNRQVKLIYKNISFLYHQIKLKFISFIGLLNFPLIRYFKLLSSKASKPINIYWIRTGSDPYTENLCKASYYRQFSRNMKIKIIGLIPVLLAQAFSTSGLTKLVFTIFHSNTRGKLSIKRCDK